VEQLGGEPARERPAARGAPAPSRATTAS
jgi:hypothetical protein